MNRLYEFNIIYNLDDIIEENRLYHREKAKGIYISTFVFFLLTIYTNLTASTHDEKTLALIMLFTLFFCLLIFFVSFITRPKMIKKQYEMVQMKNNIQQTYRFDDKIYLINKHVETLDDNVVKELEKFGIEKEKNISYRDVRKIKKYKNCIILYLNNNLYIPLREKNIVLGNWNDCYNDLKNIIETNKNIAT